MVAANLSKSAARKQIRRERVKNQLPLVQANAVEDIHIPVEHKFYNGHELFLLADSGEHMIDPNRKGVLRRRLSSRGNREEVHRKRAARKGLPRWRVARSGVPRKRLARKIVAKSRVTTRKEEVTQEGASILLPSKEETYERDTQEDGSQEAD
uniref:Uncharacterized protein n=1 Tax=Ditylenchus dipsaci TaxID=166011 RepID=A0A915DDA2_9BILA